MDILAEAQVMVGANLSNFDQAMDLLPSKAKKQIEKTVEIIETKIKAVKAEIPLHVGNPAEIQQLNDYLAQLKANLDSVKTSAIGQAQAIGQVSAEMGKAAQATQKGRAGFQNFGYGMLMVSQAVEDLQYGFSAIVNNIPGIAMAFGASAGVAGGLSLASVAINVLINNWEKLGNALGMGKVKTAAEEMEELRKKTSLTADEAERLARADNLKNKVKELQGLKTKAQTQEESDVTQAIGEAGFRNVVGGIMKTAPDMVDSMGEAGVLKKKIEDAQKELEAMKQDAKSDTTGTAFQDIATQAENCTFRNFMHCTCGRSRDETGA
jgi:hypothetical protein